MTETEKNFCEVLLREATELGQVEVQVFINPKYETIEQFNIWVEGISEQLNYHITRINGEWVYIHRCI